MNDRSHGTRRWLGQTCHKVGCSQGLIVRVSVDMAKPSSMYDRSYRTMRCTLRHARRVHDSLTASAIGTSGQSGPSFSSKQLGLCEPARLAAPPQGACLPHLHIPRRCPRPGLSRVENLGDRMQNVFDTSTTRSRAPHHVTEAKPVLETSSDRLSVHPCRLILQRQK